MTANKAANFARRFLNSKLQAGRNKAVQQQPYGSKWPNKHPWKNIVNSLNSYNLTNAQKNMIRRVNIAVAAQPKKGAFEKRASVNFNLKGLGRNQAVQKQKNALQAARQRQARQRQSQRQRQQPRMRNNPVFQKENTSVRNWMATGGA